MTFLRHFFRTLLFLAATCLVVNDGVRLFCPQVQQYMTASSNNAEQEEDNNPVNSFSLLEEEVKNHYHPERFLVAPIPEGYGIDAAADHLIKDDEVRHLAFIPIFSPPPNRV